MVSGEWDAPAPVPDDFPRLAAWVEAVTGLELDKRGSVRVLDRAAWRERRRRLEQLGGPPPAVPRTRLDPILYGADPTARGDAWKDGHWEQAEAAYSRGPRCRSTDSPPRPGPAEVSAVIWIGPRRRHGSGPDHARQMSLSRCISAGPCCSRATGRDGEAQTPFCSNAPAVRRTRMRQ